LKTFLKILKIFGIVLGSLILLAVLAFLIVPFLIPVPPLEGIQSVEQLADADSKFVQINSLSVHYKERGAGEPVIILLHGFGANTYSWREVMDPLAVNGRVLAYDRPAFGLTSRPMPGEWTGENPYGFQAQVDLLFKFMDQMGVQKAILVGNSAGGTVAVDAALQHPERVQALVLVDAAIYTGHNFVPDWLRWILDTPQMNRIGPLFVRSIESWGVDFLNSAWHDPSKIKPDVLENYKKPLHMANWDRALWEMTKATSSVSLADRLGELHLPVLVVTGDDDRIVDTELSLRLAQDIPGAELSVFKDCGHVPQEECPEQFLPVVNTFIQSLNP
jgi:pimeloyl-ACP methyl ester carboxylesterase